MDFNNLIVKIKKIDLRSRMIIREFFLKWRDYGLSYAYYSSIYWIGWYTPFKGLMWKGHEGKTKFLNAYFEKYFSSIIDEYKNKKESEKLAGDYKFFVLWWQGYDNMPALVKACYNNLKKNEGGDVILITKKNISEYIDIPDHIYKRLDKGDITFTHFSDIVRVSILPKYGGMWVDATCWMPNKMPDSLKQLSLLTPNTKNLPELAMWSNSKWCGWNIGTALKDEVLLCFARDILYKMHTIDKYLPDYVILDFIFFYAYQHFDYITALIDDVPEYSVNRNQLWFCMNKEFRQDEYEKICENNYIFKLSYKTQLVDQVAGKETFYGFIKQS